MDRLQRIALYGGTFDPVHVGHLTVAENLLKLFALDEVLFIPAHVAPHKREKKVTRGMHRYAMLALATQHEAALRVSTIELDAPESPYTVDTLSRLQEEFRRAAQLFFIMGMDSWMEITTWREWERVLSLVNHIVMTRPGYKWSTAHVPPRIQERIVDLRGASPEEITREIEHSEDTKIYVTNAVSIELSSTAIRKAVREGKGTELKNLVPPPVADYIKKYRLY